MKTFVLVCAVAAASLGFLGYRGNRTLRRRELFLQHMREIDNTELEYLGYISYHGGLPEIPKPQKLNVAVSKDYLLLFSNSTSFSKVAFDRWHSIDTFTTKRKQDPRKKSLILWGPYTHLLHKDVLRHFIVIPYVDLENQENHLLLEHSSSEGAKELWERLAREHKSFQQNN
jgi:hypothetical protein